MQQVRKGEERDVTVSFFDDSVPSNPAPIDGVPAWTVADSDVFTLVPGKRGELVDDVWQHVDDPMSCVVQGTGDVIGTITKLTMEADADLGAGFVSVTASEDVQLISGQATVASFGFSEPRPISTP